VFAVFVEMLGSEGVKVGAVAKAAGAD